MLVCVLSTITPPTFLVYLTNYNAQKWINH